MGRLSCPLHSFPEAKRDGFNRSTGLLDCLLSLPPARLAFLRKTSVRQTGDCFTSLTTVRHSPPALEDADLCDSWPTQHLHAPPASHIFALFWVCTGASSSYNPLYQV